MIDAPIFAMGVAAGAAAVTLIAVAWSWLDDLADALSDEPHYED